MIDSFKATRLLFLLCPTSGQANKKALVLSLALEGNLNQGTPGQCGGALSPASPPARHNESPSLLSQAISDLLGDWPCSP